MWAGEGRRRERRIDSCAALRLAPDLHHDLPELSVGHGKGVSLLNVRPQQRIQLRLLLNQLRAAGERKARGSGALGSASETRAQLKRVSKRAVALPCSSSVSLERRRKRGREMIRKAKGDARTAQLLISLWSSVKGGDGWPHSTVSDQLADLSLPTEGFAYTSAIDQAAQTSRHSLSLSLPLFSPPFLCLDSPVLLTAAVACVESW